MNSPRGEFARAARRRTRILRKAANQDISKRCGGLTVSRRHGTNAMHEVNLEIGVSSQGEQIVVVIGGVGCRNGNIERLCLPASEQLPCPSDGFDGFM